jgi:hypothetical protein
MSALRKSAPALFLPLLLAAQSTILQIQVVQGEGAAHAAGSRVSAALSLKIADELGRPVKGALVSFRLPDDGPTGLFANGLNTEVVMTGEDGAAFLPTVRWNRLPGPFYIRIAAVKDQSRAGTAVSQYLTDASGGSHNGPGPVLDKPLVRAPSGWKPRNKWVVIGLLAAGAAGVGFTTGWTAGPKSQPQKTPAPAPVPLQVGSPTISIGKP